MSLMVAMLRTNRFTRTMAGPSRAMDNVLHYIYVQQAKATKDRGPVLWTSDLDIIDTANHEIRSPVPFTPDGRILASYIPCPKI
jgi:hypothetical protein